MQKDAQTEAASRDAWWQTPLAPRVAFAAVALIVVVGSLFLAVFWINQAQSIATSTMPANGPYSWSNDTRQTAPTFTVTPPAVSQIGVDPLFQRAYSRQNGTSSLGAPLTTAFPTRQGWVQFFVSGALLLPKPQPGASGKPSLADQEIAALISAGQKDPDTGILRLPLIQGLLTVGSLVPIGADSHLTYVDLRTATDPALMVPNPAADSSASTTLPGNQQSVFIAEGTRAGETVGHLIPAVIWQYLTRPAESPDGWQADVGDPLTEALPFTTRQQRGVHHMLVQVFWRGALVVDETALDAAGQPTITRLDTGLAYLQTLGPPSAAIGNSRSVWAREDAALLSVPGTGAAIAHIGQDFPLTLVGDTAWSAGELWYHVRWQGPKTAGAGWAPAAAVMFAAPGQAPGWASFDVLAPDLAEYLASQGENAAAVVYDVSRQRYYTYQMDQQFIMGSSVKVSMMLAFLNMTESQGREPDDDELNLLTKMIENSDNDAAGELYYNEIGGAQGLAAYLNQIGVTGLDPVQDLWGYSTVMPLTMVRLLTLLYEGKVLTAQDRALALNLMENVELDQQAGVGDTAPPGATVAMKDGWVQADGPDGPGSGPWAMNSSGIVRVGQETYIIAVYTDGQDTLEDGQAIVRQVCSMVASALT